jgi:hypothetical protein
LKNTRFFFFTLVEYGWFIGYHSKPRVAIHIHNMHHNSFVHRIHFWTKSISAVPPALLWGVLRILQNCGCSRVPPERKEVDDNDAEKEAEEVVRLLDWVMRMMRMMMMIQMGHRG